MVNSAKRKGRLWDAYAFRGFRPRQPCCDRSTIGERKKGDLADLFAYKFRSMNQLDLLGYSVDDEVCLAYLEAVASHENFYCDLKRS